MNFATAFPTQTFNPPPKREEMREILLDPQDDWLREFSFYPNYKDNKLVSIKCHYQGKVWQLGRLILHPVPDDKQIDHRSGDVCDHRRDNMRIVTPTQNLTNRRTMSASGYKGVRKHRVDPRWEAYITFQQKFISLGYFDTAEEASYAYDDAARDLHKEYGRYNHPRVGEQQA
jgi:hypothetical protein